MKRISPQISVGIILALTVGLCVVIGFDLYPPLRGPQVSNSYEWAWQHVSPPDLVPWKLIFPVSVISLIGIWAFYNRNVKNIGFLQILVLVGLALAFRLSVQETGLQGNSIVARVLNPSYQGYFPPATEIDDMADFLRHYADIQAGLPYKRLVTHPPGNTVFYWLVLKTVEAVPALTQPLQPFLTPRIAAWPVGLNSYSIPQVVAGIIVALLVPGLSALSIWPLYHTANLLFGANTARLSAFLFVFVPALTLFTPVTDDLYTFEAALALWFITSGFYTNDYWRFWLAGLLTGATLFQSLSTIPLVVLIGLSIVLYTLNNWQTTGTKSLLKVVAYGLGVPMVWLTIWLIFGLNPIQVILNCLTNYEAHMRSYWLSLIYNPWDILLFASMPLAIHFLLAIYHLVIRLFKRTPFTLADSILLGFLGALLALFVGGSLRGETARTLLFVYPTLTLFAAHNISQETDLSPYYPFLLAGLMGLQTIIFQATLAVYH